MTDPDRSPAQEQALAQSGESAEQDFGRESADGSIQACETEATWIDIELVGEDDEPIPNVRFEVFKPDGTLLGKGRLDENGCGGFQNIDQGDYEVCFPELDQDAWEPA